MQKTLNNLKNKPKEDRQVVAVSAAGAVVLILLVAWAFFFLKSLRREQSTQFENLDVPIDTAYEPVQQTGVYENTQYSDQFGQPADTE